MSCSSLSSNVTPPIVYCSIVCWGTALTPQSTSNYPFQGFSVACYATLQAVFWMVHQLVGRNFRLFISRLHTFRGDIASLLLPKCLTGLQLHRSCPPARDRVKREPNGVSRVLRNTTTRFVRSVGFLDGQLHFTSLCFCGLWPLSCPNAQVTSKYGPRLPARHWGSRVSILVSIHVFSFIPLPFINLNEPT